MQTVLTTIATQADADISYTRRPDQATFTASTLVQTLVFGWLAHPAATLEHVTQMAARVGVVMTNLPATARTKAYGTRRMWIETVFRDWQRRAHAKTE